MAAPVDDFYQAASGSIIQAGIAQAPPAWLEDRDVGEWFAITGSALGRAQVGGGSFCGMSVREESDRIILTLGPNGGHSNGNDNGIYALDLMDDAPTWATLKAASSTSGWDLTGNTSGYMPDGTPAAAHTYWFVHWVPEHGRHMTFGRKSVGSAAVDVSSTSVDYRLLLDAFDPDAAVPAWDASGSWPNLPVAAQVSVRDPVSGYLYGVQGSSMIRYNPNGNGGAGQFTSISLSGTGSPHRGAMAYDTARDHIYHLCTGDNFATGDTTITSMTISPSGVKTPIALSGAGLTAFQSQGSNYLTAALDYNPDLDVYYWYNGGAEGAQKIYIITPNATASWTIAQMSVTGVTPPRSLGGANNMGGVCNKFRYISALKCLVLQADGGLPVHAIRTE